MISYECRGRDLHAFRHDDARCVYAQLAGFLAKCTDSRGPQEVAGIPIDRYPVVVSDRLARADRPSTLVVLGELVDELVRDGRPCRLDLTFRFLLQEGGALLSYADVDSALDESDVLSAVQASVSHGQVSRIGGTLRWPFESITEQFLRSHDEIFGSLGIDPYPDCWRRGSGDAQTPIVVDRGALVPPPTDPTGARLHAAIVENPDDSGSRLAYADWLMQRGDPLGEMLVIQTELASDNVQGVERRAALIERADELLAANGHRWSHSLVTRPRRELSPML